MPNKKDFTLLKYYSPGVLELEACQNSVMAVNVLLPRHPPHIVIKMEGKCETLEGNNRNEPVDTSEDLDKILSVVVKRRKTIPTKILEINKEINEYEILRLENAIVVTEEDEEENLKKKKFESTSKEILKKLKELKSSPFILSDIQQAEEKLKKLHEKAIQINSYLEKRKKLKYF